MVAQKDDPFLLGFGWPSFRLCRSRNWYKLSTRPGRCRFPCRMGKVVFEGCTTYSVVNQHLTLRQSNKSSIFLEVFSLLEVVEGFVYFCILVVNNQLWRGPRVIHWTTFCGQLAEVFFWLVTMWDDHQVYILSWIRFDSISHTARGSLRKKSRNFLHAYPRISSWKTTNKKRCDASKTNQTDWGKDRFFSGNQDINSTKNRGGPLKWVVFFLEHFYSHIFFLKLWSEDSKSISQANRWNLITKTNDLPKKKPDAAFFFSCFWEGLNYLFWSK